MGFEMWHCAPEPTAIQSSTLEETMDPGKLQTDVGASDDDDSNEDYVDSEEDETSDDESAKDKNRPAKKTLKTPLEKKAKMKTPSKGSGTGMRSGYVHVATPYPSKLVKKTPSIVERPKQSAKDKNRPAEKPLKTPPEKKAKMTTPSKGSGTGMRSGYVHVATPYPSKLVKKTPSVIDRPKQPGGYACNSCSRTFNSYIALKTHCKVKKHKRLT